MAFNEEISKQIQLSLGDFEVSECYTDGKLLLRFGYWRRIAHQTLCNILKDYSVEEYWDKDEDTGVVWMYEVGSK
jgi:hypothetical protein